MRTSKRARQLATDVENLILVSPHRHNQNVYVQQTDCGTTACVAGWATIMQGWQLEFLVGQDYAFWARRRPEETPEYIFDIGQKGLGLNYTEATWLFDGKRPRDEVLSGLACVREGNAAKMKEIMANSDEDK